MLKLSQPKYESHYLSVLDGIRNPRHKFWSWLRQAISCQSLRSLPVPGSVIHTPSQPLLKRSFRNDLLCLVKHLLKIIAQNLHLCLIRHSLTISISAWSDITHTTPPLTDQPSTKRSAPSLQALKTRGARGGACRVTPARYFPQIPILICIVRIVGPAACALMAAASFPAALPQAFEWHSKTLHSRPWTLTCTYYTTHRGIKAKKRGIH